MREQACTSNIFTADWYSMRREGCGSIALRGYGYMTVHPPKPFTGNEAHCSSCSCVLTWLGPAAMSFLCLHSSHAQQQDFKPGSSRRKTALKHTLKVSIYRHEEDSHCKHHPCTPLLMQIPQVGSHAAFWAFGFFLRNHIVLSTGSNTT